jgi:hypothetical protein
MAEMKWQQGWVAQCNIAQSDTAIRTDVERPVLRGGRYLYAFKNRKFGLGTQRRHRRLPRWHRPCRKIHRIRFQSVPHFHSHPTQTDMALPPLRRNKLWRRTVLRCPVLQALQWSAVR